MGCMDGLGSALVLAAGRTRLLWGMLTLGLTEGLLLGDAALGSTGAWLLAGGITLGDANAGPLEGGRAVGSSGEALLLGATALDMKDNWLLA